MNLTYHVSHGHHAPVLLRHNFRIEILESIFDAGVNLQVKQSMGNLLQHISSSHKSCVRTILSPHYTGT
jgi:hypothetical protein